MPTNILKAILNIKDNKEYSLSKLYPDKSQISVNNRINSTGKKLEFFTKDAFCGSFNVLEKNKIFSENFSYLGNKNNPPDLIIKNSDAVEVKKIESNASHIQLNSSYPKSYLSS